MKSSTSFRLAAVSMAAFGLAGAASAPSDAVPTGNGSVAVVSQPTPSAAPPSPAGASPTSPTSARVPTSRAATRAPGRDAATVFARMSQPQRIGQLFMVGTPAGSASAATRRQIGRFHVGNIMLTGRSYAGTRAPARVAATMQARTTRAATDGVRLLVATDQEGGDVQVLHGRGISEIPSALVQGSFSLPGLRSAAGRWARQLRAAGVNMNLGPVLDTVPGPAAALRNPPIGVYDREYGFTPTRVGRHGLAVVRGMADRGVASSVKHFPGLGRVHGNTDFSAGVTDRVTRRRDPYLAPFRSAIRAGVPFVMMSTAYYSRLDRANPAAFSTFVIGTLLRRDLGFRGVVVSDDLASARQVSRWPSGARAVKFLRAGGDLVLTVDPATLPAMYGAVLSEARRNPAFRAKVNRSVLRVLRAKERQHLLGR